MMRLPVLSEAAARAPESAGVYFFLSCDRQLLYVGKAGHLRKRLQQHALARGAGSWRDEKYERVDEVCWEETPDEATASAREADVIVALRPQFNAYTDQGRWTYILVERSSGRRGHVRFDMSDTPGGAGRGAYGCFPHLGRGASLRPALVCTNGYAGFLRLLWASSGEGQYVPACLARSAPVTYRTVVDPSLHPALHSFLSGTSSRLLTELARSARWRDEFMQPALRRDLKSAFAFFARGPKALRRLRLQHRLPPGPMSREVVERLIAASVRDAIGDFR